MKATVQITDSVARGAADQSETLARFVHSTVPRVAGRPVEFEKAVPFCYDFSQDVTESIGPKRTWVSMLTRARIQVGPVFSEASFK